MAPRSAMSLSTTASSVFTDDVSVPPSMATSIDVISLDDPAKMSPQAIRAELQYYGVPYGGKQSNRATMARRR